MNVSEHLSVSDSCSEVFVSMNDTVGLGWFEGHGICFSQFFDFQGVIPLNHEEKKNQDWYFHFDFYLFGPGRCLVILGFSSAALRNSSTRFSRASRCRARSFSSSSCFLLASCSSLRSFSLAS